MKNLAWAFIPTTLVWLYTFISSGTLLPFFTMFIIYCLSYLMIKELGYEKS